MRTPPCMSRYGLAAVAACFLLVGAFAVPALGQTPEGRVAAAGSEDSVEELFKVSVVKVNTMIRVGKKRRERSMQYGMTSPWKRAVVTLKDGDTIEVEISSIGVLSNPIKDE